MIFNELHSVFPINGKFHILYAPKEAYAYYKDKRVNLITGEESPWPLDLWVAALDEVYLVKKKNQKRVVHLFYELGKVFELEELPDDLLGVDISFTKKVIIKNFEKTCDEVALTLTSCPTYEEYEKSFSLCQENLKKGNCYQINLTFPFVYKFKAEDPVCFYKNLWKKKENIAPYAHGTYIPKLKKLYLSNSPECLFQCREEESSIKLWSMPIKGTVKKSGALKDDYKKLLICPKNRGELYMITDLLKNDLSKIGDSYSKVIRKRAPLVAPGIVHQFSLISVDLLKETSLKKVLMALFPGGSITGAPKKRVMEIISSVEPRERSFYTGSTVVLLDDIVASSINIRSAEVCFQENLMTYNAGGGVTLLSDCKDEFHEMKAKVDSFILTLS